MEVKKKKKSPLATILLLILFAMGFFAYMQSTANYRNLQKTLGITQDMLEKQFGINEDYAMQLVLYKANLKQAEAYLAQEKKDNKELRSKLAMLDRVDELEQTIAVLRLQNEEMLKSISMKRSDTNEQIDSLATLEESKQLLSKYKDHLKRIKGKIGYFKRKIKNEKVIALREYDKRMLLLGNNGYMVRNGKILPSEILPIERGKNVTIDVKIVE